MRNACLLVISIFFISCGPQFYPLEGKYPKSPVIGYSDQSVEVIWNQIIDFLSKREMEFKRDSSAGLIISRKSKLSATYEDADGNLYFPDSYVVVQQESVYASNHAKRPELNFMGQWFIFIERKDGRTSVRISLMNIRATRHAGNDWKDLSYSPTPIPPMKTTGVFEKEIFAAIQAEAAMEFTSK